MISTDNLWIILFLYVFWSRNIVLSKVYNNVVDDCVDSANATILFCVIDRLQHQHSVEPFIDTFSHPALPVVYLCSRPLYHCKCCQQAKQNQLRQTVGWNYDNRINLIIAILSCVKHYICMQYDIEASTNSRFKLVLLSYTPFPILTWNYEKIKKASSGRRK